MRQPTRRVALAAITCAIAMSACGEETEAPTAHGTPRPMSREERSASQRLRQFLAAMEAKEDARACRMMTPDLRRAITSSGKATFWNTFMCGQIAYDWKTMPRPRWFAGTRIFRSESKRTRPATEIVP